MGIMEDFGWGENYFANRFKALGSTFLDSWTKELPKSAEKWWSGLLTMATSYQPDRDSFGKGIGLWLDGFVGMGSAVLGGTLGTAFQLPALHDATVGLDKAYRYGIARPVSWSFATTAFGGLAAADAKRRGQDPMSAYLGSIFSWDTFLGSRGMWSDSIGKITPGQAVVWAAGGQVGHINPGNPNDPSAWLRSHDPRTEEGQARFNSENADFLLKYASGTLDFGIAIGADPSVPAAAVLRGGKGKFDHVATPEYKARGGIEREVTTKNFDRVFDAALATKSVERFRDRVMPHARNGGRVAPVLYTAAKLGKDVFRDAWVIARGMDGLFDRTTGMGAWERMVERAPAIASDFVRIFAALNIGEDALALARDPSASKSMSSLAFNDVNAFVAAIKQREGPLGKLPGTLAGEAMPKVSRMSGLRAGIHSYVMHSAPIHVGKRHIKNPATALQVWLPSQGYTAFLDAQDGTALSLRQFKANLERSGMDEQRVEFWVANWGAKQTREGRTTVYEFAEEDALAVIAERHGLSVDVVKDALPAISQYRDATRQILQRQRIYIADKAQRQGARLVAEGRKVHEKSLRDLNKELTEAEKRGEFGDAYSAVPNVDGHTSLVGLPDTRLTPRQGADPTRPVTLTQTEPMIPTLDYRALDASLTWWKLQHRPEASTKGVVLSKVAKTRAAWDGLITASDFANMVWKSSALLRPAQTPRNLADDVLRRYLWFGKLPMIMSLMKGSKRTFQMAGIRGKLVHEAYLEARAERLASRDTVLEMTAVADEVAPHNLSPQLRAATAAIKEELRIMAGTKALPQNPTPEQVIEAAKAARLKGAVSRRAARRVEKLPMDIGQAWVDGLIGLEDLLSAIAAFGSSKYYARLGQVYNIENLRSRGTLPFGDAMEGPGTRAMASLLQDSRPLTDAEIQAKAINQAEQNRWFKRLLLMKYFDRAGRRVAFLDDRRLEADPLRTQVNNRELWLTRLIESHRDSRGGANPYQPGHILIDPFTGDVPRHIGVSGEDFTTTSLLNLNDPLGKSGRIKVSATNSLEYYILNHLDDLMRPDHLLSLVVTSQGNVRMGVARIKSEVAAREPIKLSATRRLRGLKFDPKAIHAGHDRVRVTVFSGGDDRKPGDAIDDADYSKEGVELEFQGATEGDIGESFHHRLSAYEGAGSTNYLVGDVSQERLLKEQGGWGITRPGDKGHEKNWERAVNAQLAGDEVAKRFIKGWTDADVIDWIESTPEGSEYVQRSKHFGVAYVDHVRQIQGFVEEYIPREDSEAGRRLRQAVLERKATYADLRHVRPNPIDQPEVHGASLDHILGRGAVFRMVANAIDKAQQYISDLPTDKASRFPFFAEAYRRHLTDLVRMADFNALKVEDVIPARLLRNIEQQARERALYDTKYRLYDVAQVNDIARMTRFIVPFSSAIMDSYLKYGRLIRDTGGGAALQGLYYWQMFERNETIQDENGHVLRLAEDGSEHWYGVDPKSGDMTEVPLEQVGKDRYVQFRLPSGLGHLVGKKYFGVDMQPVMAVNKKTFNVFLDLPSSGPWVGVLANKFAMSNPEFGESQTIRRFVLPFGPSTSSGKVLLPSTVRTAWDLFVSEDGDRAEAQAKAIFQAELISYAREERDDPPSFVEVRERASAMRGLRFLSSWISPVSFQTKSPYQPYIDAYRQLRTIDAEGADEAFLARHGDEFYSLAMTVTRNNAGITASASSHKSYLRHKDLVAAYPELAGLIVGAEGGAFSKSVYEIQKATELRPGSDTKLREVISLEESVEDMEKRRVWNMFTKMQDLITADMVERGITSLRSRAAKDLVEKRDAFIKSQMTWVDPASGAEVVSPWFRDYTTNDSRAVQNRILSMWAIVQDPDLQKRDDIRGLIEYLSARERFQERMADRGLKTLSGRRAKNALAEWNTQSFAIREANPAFAQLWARWLSNDDELAM